MSITLCSSREAHAHARRFLSRLAPFAEPATPELVQLWQMLGRPDLSDARSRVAARVATLVDNADLQGGDMHLLLGLSYLRLQYLLEVQRAGPDIEGLLRDPAQ